nr:protein DDC8 homolog [Microcebus murinus]XP_012611732.1 protein DDC8 homolog [Microcebus murinus]XP_012611733.1 protein DDC8 homolog [Microcebus murinus]
MCSRCDRSVIWRHAQSATDGPGICGSSVLGPPEPAALGYSRHPSETMPVGFSEMNRNVERAVWRSPNPDDGALHLGQKRKLLQVREKEEAAPPRRPDVRLWKSCQLHGLAEELRAAWQEAQHRHSRLSTARWRRTKDREPDQDEPLQQAAARSLRARERNRAALRDERSRKEEPGRHGWHPRAWRLVGCTERQAATRTASRVHLPLSPPEKSQGKQRVPWTKSGGGRRPVTTRGGRRVDPLLAPAGETKQRVERETTQEGRRQQEKGTASLVRGRNLSLEGKPRAGEQRCPADCTCRRGAQASQCTCSDKSEWQKELESTFEELFNTNRKLKKHLSLHLESRPRAAQNSDEEQAVSGSPDSGSETPREKKAEDEEETPAGESDSPAGVEAQLTASGSDLETLLSRIENLKYHQSDEPDCRSESQMQCPEAGTSVDEEDKLSCVTSAAATPTVERAPQLHLRDQTGGAGSLAAWRQKQKQEAEEDWRLQRQQDLLEQPEHPNMSLEIHYMPELEKERKERRRTRLALLNSYPSRGWDTRRGPQLSLTEEEWHSQMIRDLQYQISEQDKMHKQFLEEARRRLREFQD